MIDIDKVIILENEEEYFNNIDFDDRSHNTEN